MKIRLSMIVMTIGSVVSVAAWSAGADRSYDVKWWTVDGGGVMFATGGAYKLGGTIGQPDAGVLSGEGYVLKGGFWAVAPVCTAPDAPLAEPTVPDMGSGTRVRYLALQPNPEAAGRSQAIRVTFADLPSPFEYAEGRVMWVGAPVDVSEIAGSLTLPPTFKLSELQCDPFFTDWTQYGTVYVTSESLVPRGIYDVQAIDEACSMMVESHYSDPLPVKLSKWGDTVGGDNAASPQGTIDFVDISSVVDKFKNLPGAPTKSRSDVAPSLPDKIIDFVDIPSIVDAFRGLPYPYSGPPVTDPCP